MTAGDLILLFIKSMYKCLKHIKGNPFLKEICTITNKKKKAAQTSNLYNTRENMLHDI